MNLEKEIEELKLELVNLKKEIALVKNPIKLSDDESDFKYNPKEIIFIVNTYYGDCNYHIVKEADSRFNNIINTEHDKLDRYLDKFLDELKIMYPTISEYIIFPNYNLKIVEEIEYFYVSKNELFYDLPDIKKIGCLLYPFPSRRDNIKLLAFINTDFYRINTERIQDIKILRDIFRKSYEQIEDHIIRKYTDIINIKN